LKIVSRFADAPEEIAVEFDDVGGWRSLGTVKAAQRRTQLRRCWRPIEGTRRVRDRGQERARWGSQSSFNCGALQRKRGRKRTRLPGVLVVGLPS
jgi:hypothetical protein